LSAFDLLSNSEKVLIQDYIKMYGPALEPDKMDW